MSMTFTPPKASEIERAASLAFFAAKEQILTDCNFFAKYDQGVMKSGAYATADKMEISCHWPAPYAGYAWYKGRPSHSGTFLMWGEHAADTYGGQWCDILSKGLNDAIRN
jgi:hypothetical protein